MPVDHRETTWFAIFQAIKGLLDVLKWYSNNWSDWRAAGLRSGEVRVSIGFHVRDRHELETAAAILGADIDDTGVISTATRAFENVEVEVYGGNCKPVEAEASAA